MKNNKLVSLLVLLSIITTACVSTEYIYVTHRDVLDKPVFTTLRTYSTSNDTSMARVVESYLIAMGLSVVNPPIEISVVVKTGAIDADATQSTGVKEEHESKGKISTGEVEEAFYKLDDTRADYLIYVDSNIKVFRVVKKDTKEILAVSDIFKRRTSFKRKIHNEMYELFTNLGFKVKGPKE